MTLVNQRFCEMLGYRQDELIGTLFQDITHQEDLAEVTSRFAHLLATGQSFDMEKRCLRKNGNFVWSAISVSALRDERGAIRQVGFIAIDISASKKAQAAERHLASIIDSSNDAILGIDLDMVITSWNAAAEKMYGYSKEEAVGRSVLMLVPKDRQDEEPAIVRRISAGLTVEPYETQRLRKDGHLVDVQLSVSPIYDGNGKAIGASKISQDITARKEAERLQNVLTGELSHRVKNVFATVLAISRQTLNREDVGRAEVSAFEARLHSMAQAHDLLTHGDWQKASLVEIVHKVVEPYPKERFAIDGSPVLLPQKAVVSFSLAIHELATNAAKYGALSVPEGLISVAWRFDEQTGKLDFRWQESRGPMVVEPTRKGFGSRLVERLLAAELKGTSKITYDPQGVVCEIETILDPEH